MAYDETIKSKANRRRKDKKQQQQRQQLQICFNLIKYLKHRHDHLELFGLIKIKERTKIQKQQQ